MESKTKNRKTREQIERMTMRAFNGTRLAPTDDAVTELKQGWFNAAYAIRLADGRETILKIAPPGHAEVMLYEKNIMATEVASMRLARRNPAIPVPEIFFFDQRGDLCDSDYFFMEKLTGDNLEHARNSLDPKTLARVRFQIGEIIREINSLRGTYFGYAGNPALRGDTWRGAFTKIIEALLEDAARKDVAFDVGYDEIRAMFLKHAPALEEVTTPCLVHWDAWDPNFFVADGKVTGIIDFERALWAEPLMEAQFRRPDDGSITDSMRGYGKTSLTVAEERRSHLYSLHLALVMHTECFYRHYDTDDILNLSRQLIGKAMNWLRSN